MLKSEQETLEFMKAMRNEFKAYEFRVTVPLGVITSKRFNEEKPGVWVIPQTGPKQAVENN